MGQVWSASHLVTGRRVAIKRLLLASADYDEAQGERQALARFMLEAQTASAVEHPNVVQILDFIEPGDEPAMLVMEMLEGETLAARLEREHALSLEDTANVLLPVVSAVGTAHSLGIIHRDLKPANIFLQQRSGQAQVVKVLDFGIAKWVAQRPEGSGLRTQTGSTLGTPCYMAPEQATGERRINHAADIWSLGVILYECLAGVRPVEGENAAQMVARLLNTGIMPIEQIVPTLPADLAGLIGRMLARDAAQRPKDLREVFSTLRAHGTSSAPTFSEPALAADAAEPSDSTRAGDAATPLWAATHPGMRSLSVDAHAATVPDPSTPAKTPRSWQGQSVPTQGGTSARRSRARVVFAIAVPAVAVGLYLLAVDTTLLLTVRPSNVRVAPSASPSPRPSDPRDDRAAIDSSSAPSPTMRGPTEASSSAPPVQLAPPEPSSRAPAYSMSAAGGMKPNVTKSAIKTGRLTHPNPEDEDGTWDRK